VVRIGRLGGGDREANSKIVKHRVCFTKGCRSAAVERFFNEPVQAFRWGK
jgi:hypothetical protein